MPGPRRSRLESGTTAPPFDLAPRGRCRWIGIRLVAVPRLISASAVLTRLSPPCAYGVAVPRCACMYGHGRSAHQHYRSGTECALCSSGQCARYRCANPLRRLGAPSLGSVSTAEMNPPL